MGLQYSFPTSLMTMETPLSLSPPKVLLPKEHAFDIVCTFEPFPPSLFESLANNNLGVESSVLLIGPQCVFHTPFHEPSLKLTCTFLHSGISDRAQRTIVGRVLLTPLRISPTSAPLFLLELDCPTTSTFVDSL